MARESKNDFDYLSTLARLNPVRLAFFLPEWTFKDKVFVQIFKGKTLLDEEGGWIFYAPNARTLLKIEVDAKRVAILDGIRDVSLERVRRITARHTPESNLIRFDSRNSYFSLRIPNENPKYEIEYRSKTSDLATVKWESTGNPTPELTPSTTLEELFQYISQTRL